MAKNASAIRSLLVPVAMLLFSLAVATPTAGARTIEARSATCRLSYHWEAPSKHLKRTFERYEQRMALRGKCWLASSRWRQPFEPPRPQFTPAVMMLPRPSQPGVCESPMRGRFFHDDVHVGLGCDDRIFDETTALDGFARMRYHIPVPR